MKKLYFHIGSGRCGSTLIQALFNDKMVREIFANHSRNYDPQVYLDTGMISHDDTFIEDHWRPIREKHFEKMKSSEVDGFFITQENLLGMRSGKDDQNICKVNCEKLAYLSEGFDPHIIIIIRRQDTYIESVYNQGLKRYETRDFETYTAEFPRENWHWADSIDVYSNYFGRDKITVVPFEQRVHEGSPFTGFLDAVLVATGITTRLQFNNLPVTNPSIAPRGLEVLRYANHHLSQEEAQKLAEWLEIYVQKDPKDPHGLMSDSVRAEILAYYKESNSRLCDEYLAAYPAAKAYYTGEAAA